MKELKEELEDIEIISEKIDTGHTIYSIKFIHSKHIIHKDVYDLLLKMSIAIFKEPIKQDKGIEEGKSCRNCIHYNPKRQTDICSDCYYWKNHKFK